MKAGRSDNEMREECDFTEGVRAKCADRFEEGSNVVVLDPDVAAFTTPEEMNEALRAELEKRRASAGV